MLAHRVIAAAHKTSSNSIPIRSDLIVIASPSSDGLIKNWNFKLWGARANWLKSHDPHLLPVTRLDWHPNLKQSNQNGRVDWNGATVSLFNGARTRPLVSICELDIPEIEMRSIHWNWVDIWFWSHWNCRHTSNYCQYELSQSAAMIRIHFWWRAESASDDSVKGSDPGLSHGGWTIESRSSSEMNPTWR